MANSQNLRRIRSTSEAREIGRIGGLASGAARRQKRYFSKTLKIIADLPAINAEQLAAEFPELSDITNQDALAITLFKKALNGDLKALDKLLGYINQRRAYSDLDDVFGIG